MVIVTVVVKSDLQPPVFPTRQMPSEQSGKFLLSLLPPVS